MLRSPVRGEAVAIVLHAASNQALPDIVASTSAYIVRQGGASCSVLLCPRAEPVWRHRRIKGCQDRRPLSAPTAGTAASLRRSTKTPDKAPPPPRLCIQHAGIAQFLADCAVAFQRAAIMNVAPTSRSSAAPNRVSRPG